MKGIDLAKPVTEGWVELFAKPSPQSIKEMGFTISYERLHSETADGLVHAARRDLMRLASSGLRFRRAIFRS
ncbi:MAG: hypothetical protein ACRECL_02610, partial [Bradyrhizobium sp.]